MTMLKWSPDPHPPLFKALLICSSLMNFFFKSHDRFVVKPAPCNFIGSRFCLRISDNDKPESLACDEDPELVECGLETSVLMPNIIISISFTLPATVDLATALCGFMKLNNN